MDKIINWDDYPETSFITEEGTYTLKVMSHERKNTTNNNEVDVYTCQTQDGEQIKVSLYLSEKALWKYRTFVKALGLPASGIVNFNELPNTLIGKKFIGEVSKQPDKINPITGVPEPSKYLEVSKFYPVEN